MRVFVSLLLPPPGRNAKTHDHFKLMTDCLDGGSFFLTRKIREKLTGTSSQTVSFSNHRNAPHDNALILMLFAHFLFLLQKRPDEADEEVSLSGITSCLGW